MKLLYWNTAIENQSDFNNSPFVDDGASYCAIGIVELSLMKTRDPSETMRWNLILANLTNKSIASMAPELILSRYVKSVVQ